MLWTVAIGLALVMAPSQAATQLSIAPEPVSPSMQPVLRVGVADGSQPCSYRERGRWSGMAVELWQSIAEQEGIPYVLVPGETSASLLAATRRGELDVAIGCITVSPERIHNNLFTLPFQESGLGVMTKRDQLELGGSLLRALLAPDLMRLLLAYVVLIGALSVGVWWFERNGSKPSTWTVGRKRAFALIFQVLATGPGTNTVVVSARGHTLVFLAYLVRIITASLLVSYVTLNVVRNNQELGSRSLRNLKDLAGQRVAVRRGTVSDELLQLLNSSGLQPPIQLRELDQVNSAYNLLAKGAVDAVMADDIQLDYLLQQMPHQQYVLALRNLNPQSQAFALSPRLSEKQVRGINVAMGRLKRDGVVSRLRQQAMNKS
jgi:polar amino acid transport system substrate-binding protein